MRRLTLLFISVILLHSSVSLTHAQTTITSAFSDFSGSNINAFELGGDTALNGTELRLTRAVNNLFGTAYYKKKVNLANDRSFSAHFSFKMTNPTCFIGDGADGLAFVIQQTSNTAGSAGGGLGYQGVTPSFVVEFDTFDNASAPVTEPNNNHIGININGSTNSVASFTPGNTLNDGATYYAWIDYNGANDLIEVRFNTNNTRPAGASLTHNFDLATNLSSDVFVGFSAATGGCNETHDILSFYFNNDIVPGGITPGTVTYSSAPTDVSLALSTDSIPSNGTDSTTLTATVLKVDGSAAAGVTVAFTSSLGELSAASAVTDAQGKAQVQLTSTTAGSASIRAQATGGAFDLKTVTVVQAPTPTPTPTVTPTATSTPLPTIPSNQIEGRIVVAGNPVSNALVYIPGVGTALTDSNGRFVFRNVTASGPLTAYVQKTGVSFGFSSLSISPGQFAEVEGSALSYNPFDCPENDISSSLHNAATRMRTLMETGSSSTRKLPANFSAGQNKNVTRKKLLRRLQTQFTFYLEKSRRIPEIVLTSCEANCTERAHKSALKGMRRALGNLRRGGLLATRLRSAVDGLPAAKKSILQKKIRRLSSKAQKIIKSLPKKSFRC
ncbi:MAG: Ig-like domain-containing protein [Deltaproteobacteria bacterium]|nr:Ig-like domain-containing protein [Deltaproteobacteria bacterium]